MAAIVTQCFHCQKGKGIGERRQEKRVLGNIGISCLTDELNTYKMLICF